MIFSLKQGMYTAVLFGDKTLTTRLKLPAHIAKGIEWAIVPKRAAPAWWFRVDEGQPQICTDPRGYITHLSTTAEINAFLEWDGWTQARIHIETFYEVQLQDMTHSEALREGVSSVDEYAKLWDRINDKKGFRWADNPTVSRISFRLLDEVAHAVSRVGRDAILQAAGMTPEPEKA